MKNIYVIVFLAIVASACNKSSSSASSDSSSSGQGGSLARFTVVNNFLYMVDWNSLKCYDLTQPASPVLKNSVPLNWDTETIFPYNNNLYIGSRNGMYVFSLKDPSNPVKLGEVSHLKSCDPVVANDTMAFVTLRAGTACGNVTEGLYVYNIKDPLKLEEVKLLPMTTPIGLGLNDTILYVCRMSDGLSVINVKKPAEPEILQTIKGDSFQDVIAYNNLLITYVSNGLILYDISKPAEPVELTRLTN